MDEVTVEDFFSVCRRRSVNCASRTRGLSTDCAGLTRDDFVAVARAPPVGGMELDVALVVRVDDLGGSGFALVLVFIGANG